MVWRPWLPSCKSFSHRFIVRRPWINQPISTVNLTVSHWPCLHLRARLLFSEFFHWTRPDLDTCPRSNVAALVVSFGASWVTNKLGRKISTLPGGLVFLAGAIINAAALNIAMLIIGRILLGIGVGFANQVNIKSLNYLLFLIFFSLSLLLLLLVFYMQVLIFILQRSYYVIGTSIG